MMSSTQNETNENFQVEFYGRNAEEQTLTYTRICTNLEALKELNNRHFRLSAMSMQR